MFAWLLLAGVMSVQPNVEPHKPSFVQRPNATKLQGLTSAEADALIAKLRDAQGALKAGHKEYFELLAGAPASYRAANVAPRTAFTAMSFDRPWSIERKANAGLWQPYELTYFPPGPDKLMWKVNVTIGQVGQLVRVEMLYTAPPPF